MACSANNDAPGWTQGLSGNGLNTGIPRRLAGGSRTIIGGQEDQQALSYLRFGDDQFVNQSQENIPQGAHRAPDGDIFLNFDDASLPDVAQTILGDLLEQNYLLDPRVQGTVTLQTVTPLSEDDTLATFSLILRQNGAALINRDGIYTIVPLSDASTGSLSPILADGAISLRPGYSVLIAPLQNASAGELAGVLEPLSGPQTTVRFDASRNVLILSGEASELAALRDAITLFDVDWLQGLSYGLFPLQKAQADDIVQELQVILGGANSPIKDQVVLEPIRRMNAILMVTKRKAILEDLQDWIKRLDEGGAGNQGGLYVYRIENVLAQDVADALTEVFVNNSGAINVNEASFSEETETVTIDGGDGDETSLGTGVRSQSSDVQHEDTVQIYANEVNNSLIIRAKPDTYRYIEAIIKQLDVAPLQVLIDATIAEVSLTDQLNYGVQFFLENGNGVLTSSNNASGSTDGSFPGFVASYVTGGAEVVLSALDTVTRLNVISTPRLMVLDNQSARLNVGDEVPVITQQQSTTDNETIVNSVTFRQTGVVLEISPRVSSSGLVTLEIKQETSNVNDDSRTGTLTPTISQRTIETSIAVQDGQTIFLGGLMQRSDTASKSGTPVLSDIPGIGALFGTRQNGRDRTELIILLTPRVIRNPREVQDTTDEIRQRLQNLPPEFFPQNTLTRRRVE